MYRWVEHTAELELEIEAPTLEAVFADAAAAFGELVRRDGGDPYELDVDELEASDWPALLVDWLEMLVFAADTIGFIPEAVEELRLGEQSVEGKIRGLTGDPAPLVKAVTYHRLELKEEGGDWHARVVLDV